MSIGELPSLEPFTSCLITHNIKINIRVLCKIVISHIFQIFPHIGVDFRILICEFTYMFGGPGIVANRPGFSCLFCQVSQHPASHPKCPAFLF